MSVHEIKRISLMDCPAKLRQLADTFEREHLETAVVIIGQADGHVTVRAFGTRTDALQVTGWLHRALDVMTSGAEAAPPPSSDAA